MKQNYSISGMHCNGCRTHVEKALSGVKGVTRATVNLEQAEAELETERPITLETLQQALQKSGGNYAISLPATENSHASGPRHGAHSGKAKSTPSGVESGSGYYCPMHCEGDKIYPGIGSCPVCGMDLVPLTEADEEKSYRSLLLKFKVAVLFTLPIFLIAMSEMLPHNPLSNLMPRSQWNWVQFALSLPVLFYATRVFFERAWKSLVTRNYNMFTLIGIGSAAAWLFSLWAILFPGTFPDAYKGHEGTVHVYFEATTVILTLVLLGQLLEARAHGKTQSAIKELIKLTPATATLVENGVERVVEIGEIVAGNLLRVKPGDKIAVDGQIVEGEALIDESMITGEPIPVFRQAGSPVTAGTLNGNKTFVMVAEKVGSETMLARIIEMVNAASRSKAPIQKLADKIAGYFVPVVVVISVLTFVAWSLFGPDRPFIYAFVNAIAVLIIACPCALGLATPMSVMVGVGKGARMGVLVKSAEALERMSHIDLVVVDKTGTLTEGKPSVEKFISVLPAASEKQSLQRLISLNSSSEHPLARATLNYGLEKGIDILPVNRFEAVAGKGVTGEVDGLELAFGNEALMQQCGVAIPDILLTEVQEEQAKGKTVSYLAEGNTLAGYIVISDTIKASAGEAVHQLQKDGIQVVMLTGDNPLTARWVSNSLQLDDYQAQMLPSQKLEAIKAYQAAGRKVAMAGDGINDAPALAQADVGIAMGNGTDVAIESASITLVKGNLNGIVKAFGLSRKVMRNIRENLWFALAYNALGIPIAAGALYPLFGLLLSPMIAALAMSFSSVSVITNALRLRK